MENISLAARLFIVSGKLPGLNQGLTLYTTPSGEKVNSRLLTTCLIAATIEHLRNQGALDYREEEMQVLGGKLPVLTLKRINTEGVGFERLLLEKLDIEKNLIELVKEIIGAMFEMPEYQVLWLIRSEFPEAEYMRKERVKFLFFSRWETRWIPEKVKPLVDSWLNGLAPVWETTLQLPWLKTAIRDCNFAFSDRLRSS